MIVIDWSFRKILFLICVHVPLVEPRKKYPRIQDVVTFTHELDLQYIADMDEEERSSVAGDEFETEEASFRRQYDKENPNDTKRIRRDSRRVKVGPKKKKYYDYELATQLQLRTKICDSMLQLVYMARHDFKKFERHIVKNPKNNTKSIEYKTGIIAKKLKIIFKKAVRIFEILNVKQKKNEWNGKSALAPLTLHHKVAKLYVDFEYYYEVLQRLHVQGPYRGKPIHTPKVYQLGVVDYDRMRLPLKMKDDYNYYEG